MKVLFNPVIFVGFIFSVIAAIMSFLITYNEYAHHYTTKKESFKVAFESAIFTFIVFIVLSILGTIIFLRDFYIKH